MSKASLELGGGNWAAKDRKLLGYAVGDTSGKYIPREFDFTRNSDIAATRVNEDGLIEKHRENLLLQSNNFGSTPTWDDILQGGTIAGGQSGYDGSSDAWLLEKAATTYRRIQQNVSLSGVWTMSAYLKAGTATVSRFRFDSASYMVEFDLSSGVATDEGSVSAIDYGMTKAGNGWYRCYATFNASVSIAQIYVGWADTSASNIYIQDAQLEYGLVATDYLESGATTGKAGILDNLPRIDYTGGSASLLLEPQRTNVMTNSEYFSSWNNKPDVTIEYGYAAPDGTNSASKITETGGNAHVADNAGGTIVTGVYKSIWARTVSGTGTVSLLNQFVEGSVTLTEEWQRFEASHVGVNFFYAVDFRGVDNTLTEVLVWGAQAEVGSYPTSYIPTYGASATRLKDTGSLDMITAGITTGWTSATLFIEYEKPNTGENVDTFRMHGTSDNGRAYIYNTGVGFASDWAMAGGHTLNTNVKHIWRLDSLSEGTRFKDGVKGNSGGGTAWSDIRYMYLNNQGLGGTLNIKQILLFPTALTDSECIALTTL